MPPLPNRKTTNLPNMHIASNQIKIPPRYNSVEKVIK